MRAFHSDVKIKQKYLARVERHMQADNLIRGQGWDGQRGCAVGCTLEKYDHASYETKLGIPEWLARVEDNFFERMSLKKSKTFPKEFLESINPGADLEQAKAPFLIMVLNRVLEHFDHDKYPESYQAVCSVIDLYTLGEATEKDFVEAAETSWSVWEAARAAVRSAVRSARASWEAAEVAACSARASRTAKAVAAARAATWAAEAAGTAKAAEYDYFADELLRILKEQK